MPVSRCPRWARTFVPALILLFVSWQAMAVETGPVERKWGLGWDHGLTARLWLGGVWELGLSAGPSDYLTTSEEHYYDTGQPPEWNEREEHKDRDDKRESGYVRLQAGRLVSRRGPLALVCFSGLQYEWSDTRYSYEIVSTSYPEDSRINVRDIDRSIWSLSLGLRPSFIVLDFLTIETAFGLIYSWSDTEDIDRTTYPETGRTRVDVSGGDQSSFSYSGWSGMGSLQFIVWF